MIHPMTQQPPLPSSVSHKPVLGVFFPYLGPASPGYVKLKRHGVQPGCAEAIRRSSTLLKVLIEDEYRFDKPFLAQ